MKDSTKENFASIMKQIEIDKVLIEIAKTALAVDMKMVPSSKMAFESVIDMTESYIELSEDLVTAIVNNLKERD